MNPKPFALFSLLVIFTLLTTACGLAQQETQPAAFTLEPTQAEAQPSATLASLPASPVPEKTPSPLPPTLAPSPTQAAPTLDAPRPTRGAWAVEQISFLAFEGAVNYLAVQDNFAYLGHAASSGEDTWYVVDISTPASPSVVAAVPLVFSSGGFSVVDDSFAYILDDGVRIMDISDPANPTDVGHYEHETFVIGLAVSNGYAYLAEGRDIMGVVDISDPANPKQVGSVDLQPQAFSITVSGPYAYVVSTFNDFDHTLQIVDISTPRNPVVVGTYTTTLFTAGWFKLVVSDSYLYLLTVITGMHVFDISDPANPHEVGHYSNQLEEAYLGIDIVGSYAYLANGEAGLLILDISDPTSPQELGFFACPGAAVDVAVQGDYVYVTGDEGLTIYKTSGLNP